MTGLPRLSLRRHALVLAGCIVTSFLPGALGSRFAPDAWYAHLARPALTPPGWVFPIAWTALYLTIGIALFSFLLHTTGRERRVALALFAIQLVLNGAWSWLFFGRHAPGVALLDIVLLCVAIAATSFAFGRHSSLAGRLLLPT